MKTYFKSQYTFYLLISLSFLVFSCKNKAGDPKVEAPANLIYSPNTVTYKRGVLMSSTSPTISGTTPISYTLTTAPSASGGITINPNTGVITAARSVVASTYKVTVVAKNAAASATFASAFTIEITANPDLVTFDSDIKPIIQLKCKPCHVAGGKKLQLENFANARGSINTIINNINRAQGSDGFMPKDGTKLSAAQLALFDKWKADGLFEN